MYPIDPSHLNDFEKLNVRGSFFIPHMGRGSIAPKFLGPRLTPQRLTQKDQIRCNNISRNEA